MKASCWPETVVPSTCQESLFVAEGAKLWASSRPPPLPFSPWKYSTGPRVGGGREYTRPTGMRLALLEFQLFHPPGCAVLGMAPCAPPMCMYSIAFHQIASHQTHKILAAATNLQQTL
eukprot:1147537-Pelagomonas_calceolata.AAC.9